MNLNILTYCLFFVLIGYITIQVGWTFYKNGEHFIHNLLPNDPHLVQSINKLLLLGYYLLNLGYATVIISTWETVNSLAELFSSLSSKAGTIIIGLGIMHFINILILTLYKSHKSARTLH